MGTRDHSISWAAAVIALGSCVTPGYAQDTLSEIVVTAQKREQNLQDAPVAVDAFSGAALQAAGAIQPVDLGAMTPNLSTKNAVGNTMPIFTLRGIGFYDFAPNGTQPRRVCFGEGKLA